MATVFKRMESSAPELLEATLLSSEELAECSAFVPDVPYPLPGYWYLRTPYENNKIGQALAQWEEDPIDPTWLDPGPEDSMHLPCGTGIRPIVRIKSPGLADGVTLQPGDKIEIAGRKFTVIADTILLLDDYINEEEEGVYGVFDPSTNDYERSNAKKLVDQWFEDLKSRV